MHKQIFFHGINSISALHYRTKPQAHVLKLCSAAHATWIKGWVDLIDLEQQIASGLSPSAIFEIESKLQSMNSVKTDPWIFLLGKKKH